MTHEREAEQMPSFPFLSQQASATAQIDLGEFAHHIRRWSLEMVHRANASHIGGALSAADILAALYGRILKVRPEEPAWPERDRFVMSKGHCCVGLYSALALRGFFSTERLQRYAQPGSLLMGHASHKVPGVEWSTGSLGQGLGLAAGQAYAGKLRNSAWRVYALLSDGELNEGSTWEAVMFAGHHRLEKLCMVIDKNGQQAMGVTAGILDLGAVAEKIQAFGWEACEVDGHDLDALVTALSAPPAGKPRCVVAHTVKGKGVAYMEHNLKWHYSAPHTRELFELALEQLAQGAQEERR
ncbi:MAG: transketolase [Pseudomonadota bacterium]